MNFNTQWRIVRSPEEIHQFIASGGSLICPAVLGGCGPSKLFEHTGEFWFRVNGEFGYCPTLELARLAVESHSSVVMFLNQKNDI